MKKSRFFIIAALLVAAATAVAIVSCKKDSDKVWHTNSSEDLVSQSPENMDEYLISFKKRLINAQRGSEVIDVTTAQNDLSNLLNFDFGDANYATDTFNIDTLYANINLTNEQIDLSDLAVTYNSIFQSVINTYQQSVLPEKSIYSITCNLLEKQNRNSEKGEVETVLVTRGFSGKDPTSATYSAWRPTNGGGTCDGHSIGLFGAPDIIADMLNTNSGEYKCQNGRIYFTEHDRSYKKSYNENMVDPTSPCGYKLYVSWEPNQNLVCLSHSEILYYYNQARTLWKDYDDFLPTHPSDHLPLWYEIYHMANSYNFINGHHTPCLPWVWHFQVLHAKPNCTPTSPNV